MFLYYFNSFCFMIFVFGDDDGWVYFLEFNSNLIKDWLYIKNVFYDVGSGIVG